MDKEYKVYYDHDKKQYVFDCGEIVIKSNLARALAFHVHEKLHFSALDLSKLIAYLDMLQQVAAD